MKGKKYCKTCEFYFIQDGGRCRRFPPQPVVIIEDDCCPGDRGITYEDYRFPYIGTDGVYCGEYKRKGDEDESQ